MKMTAWFVLILGFSQTIHARQVAQCLGTLVLDNSPVIARVYVENNAGRILIETDSDSVEATAKVVSTEDSKIAVSGNKFQMSFEASLEDPAFSVQAFRDGAFFVEDFYCIRVY